MEPVEENSTHNIFIDPAVVDCVREECSLDSPNSSDQESVVENIVWNAPVRINDDQTDSNFQNSVQPSNTVEEIPNGRKGLRPYDRSSRPISFVPDFRKEHNYESKQTETVKFHGFINQNSKYDESSQSLMPSSMPFSGLQSTTLREKDQERLKMKPTLREYHTMRQMEEAGKPTVDFKLLKRARREHINNKRAGLSWWGLLKYEITHWGQNKRKSRLKFPLWLNSVRFIESRFGIGIASYFWLFRWIFIMNLFLGILWAAAIIIPGAAVQDYSQMSANGLGIDKFIFAEGGYSLSFFFYGSYPKVGNGYRFDLAYMLTIAIFFILTFFGLVLRLRYKYANKTDFSSQVVFDDFRPFAAATFASWDFTLCTRKATKNHGYSISTLLRSLVTEAELKQNVKTRNSQQTIKIYFMRAVINLVVIGLFIASGLLIQISVQNETNFLGNQDDNSVILMFTNGIRSIPAVTVITIIDAIMYYIFIFLGKFEFYSDHKIETRVLLTRSFVFKIAWIYLLFLTFWNQLEEICWENLVGQRFYQLILFNGITTLFTTLIMPVVWYLVTRKKAPFDVPANILEIIKRQAALWVGVIYCPILPLYSVFFDFLIFHAKKFSLHRFVAHPQKIYNSKKHEQYFLLILLITLFTVLVPTGYTLTSLKPSCGPLSSYETFYSVIPESIGFVLNPTIKKIIQFIGSAGFLFPFTCFLLFLIVYLQAVGSKRFQREKYLEKELQAERREKRFLMQLN